MSEHRASFTAAADRRTSARPTWSSSSAMGSKRSSRRSAGRRPSTARASSNCREAPGIKTLPIREGGAWEAHDHAHEDEKGRPDGPRRSCRRRPAPSIRMSGSTPRTPRPWRRPWLPNSAKVDPANAAAYQANAKAFAASLDAAYGRDRGGTRARQGRSPTSSSTMPISISRSASALPAAGSISDVSAKAPSAQRLERNARQDRRRSRPSACSASRSMTARWSRP